jgi:hypothetical protein
MNDSNAMPGRHGLALAAVCTLAWLIGMSGRP